MSNILDNEKNIQEEVKSVELKIDGMVCIHCKNNLESGVGNLPGVLSIKVHLEKNSATVNYQPRIITMNKIEEEIENLGYNVVKNKGENLQLIGVSIIIIALYFLIQNTIGFDFIPEISENMGLGILFMIGVMTSIHCIAMCGGINLSQCMPKNPVDSKLLPSLMYNTGRVVSYTILGGIIGGLGAVFSFSSTKKGLIAIIAGVFMIIMGLNMLNIFPALRIINPRMPSFLPNLANSEKQGKGPFVVGLLNGFIPCGPLQAMQIYALGTGSVFTGAISMFLFSLGTVPLMLALGLTGAYLGGKFTGKMMKIGAVLVVVLGFIMAGRGLSIAGINMGNFMDHNHDSSQSTNTKKSPELEKKSPELEKKSPDTDNNSFENNKKGDTSVAKLEDGKQIVRSDLSGRTYHPITVQKGVPVKWIIDAKKQDLTGCNRVLTIPDYNIEKKLVPGENIIEFTPTKGGQITYTCWMGMITSTINEVEDIQK